MDAGNQSPKQSGPCVCTEKIYRVLRISLNKNQDPKSNMRAKEKKKKRRKMESEKSGDVPADSSVFRG
ncbi:hypothetical protein GGTG_13625 [Gaeumannomyces tritici R3-111a-1]|uniref:Uncharacterized protein n=1 Tax=Gaeumannomyces tritici (strain R3-111a-1) TaxID=644352 RepID=J3PJE5_GAET3|nr:hypothetical protein GGTG_13625 [Gaeumannomyces tritici R3-111a-1]EJT68811.1 hypothetical protein GGTG_13625 [Gaeumannomyces tritici R3-111a-1]